MEVPLSGPHPARGRVPWELVGWGAGVSGLLALTTRPGSALASAYVLLIGTAAVWSTLTALGRPRLALWCGRGLILSASALALSPPSSPRQPLIPPRQDFPSGRARVWHTLIAPAAWAGQGELWLYVGVQDAEPAALLAAGPRLTVDGQPLPVEADPWAPQRWLRARFPAARLGREVQVGFGFERPTPELRVRVLPFYRGSAPRAPDAWSEDGAPPAPGARLPRSEPGFLGRLAAESPWAVDGGRLAIEVRLLDPRTTEAGVQPRFLAGCY